MTLVYIAFSVALATCAGRYLIRYWWLQKQQFYLNVGDTTDVMER